MQEDHHVFLNTETKKFYCLPDNYEIVDHSLEDIKMALDPEFTPESIKKLDSNTMHYRVPTGDEYLPGEMGMNVVDNADYVNVVVQALSHVTPIRDFFLIPANYSYTSNPLVHSFGVLIRKLWSHTRFKCNVTPYEVHNSFSSHSPVFKRSNAQQQRKVHRDGASRCIGISLLAPEFAPHSAQRQRPQSSLLFYPIYRDHRDRSLLQRPH